MEKKTEPAKATEKAAGKKQAEKTRYFYLDREITAEEAGALSEPVVRGTAPGQGPSAMPELPRTQAKARRDW